MQNDEPQPSVYSGPYSGAAEKAHVQKLWNLQVPVDLEVPVRPLACRHYTSHLAPGQVTVPDGVRLLIEDELTPV